MSETQEPYTTAQPTTHEPVDPHTAIYKQVYSGIQTNNMLYEYLSGEVLRMLPGARPQAIEDALNITCVSLNKVPLDSLLLIHEFLRNYTSIMRHEKQGEPEQVEQESLFFARSE